MKWQDAPTNHVIRKTRMPIGFAADFDKKDKNTPITPPSCTAVQMKGHNRTTPSFRKTQYPCGLQHMTGQKQGGVSPPLLNRERERVLFIYIKWLRAFIHAGFTKVTKCPVIVLSFQKAGTC